MKKVLIFALFVLAVSFFLGRELNPLDPHFFTVHDNTQVARIEQFAVNLKSGILPPRVAPDFSYGFGYPVFNFYAPLSYWMGGALALVVSAATALKTLFFLGVVLSFVTMFLFISARFDFWKGIMAGSLYASSLWMAVEVFVRGNVGEIWFIALLPLGFYFLLHPKINKKPLFLIGGVFVLAALFTVHNVLSLVTLPIMAIVAFFASSKKHAFLMIFLSLLLSAYFLVPALGESRLTYATEIASKTNYADHFLCSWQLWSADHWGFGGSGKGCFADDMSFQIGKPHIIIGLIGLVVFVYEWFFVKEKRRGGYFPFSILLLGSGMAFLTTYASQPVWDLFKQEVKVFQFPWRFLPFATFALSYFAAYSGDLVKNKTIRASILVLVSLALLVTSSKFFSRPWKYQLDEYTGMFLTKTYIQEKAAYEIPEYFPRVGSYDAWRNYKETALSAAYAPTTVSKDNSFMQTYRADNTVSVLPILYFPFWQITVNNHVVVPDRFDPIGRPIVQTTPGDTIQIRYQQTPIELIGDLLTMMTFISLGILYFYTPLWNNKHNSTNR